jgi:outer membrane receptor protein involved in Fe transport
MPTKIMTRLLAGTAISALLTGAAFAADANARPYDIPQQDAATALQAYAMQSGKQVLFPFEAVKGKSAPQIKGDYSDQEVLALLANSAGLKITADDGKTVTLRPQAAAAPEGGADGTVQALIVTAQKREENIQDVPIAMSAFTQEDLTKSQVTGGPDLMTQVPNFTFTKTNFTGYSIQIRGIGTQAISATTDAAVAVAENNTPFIRNRFFEQEFYDLQRVEVLRGPQGTLYGRNATAGVVNIITAKPSFHYEAKLSADVGNYNSTRFEGMINLPLVDDKVALRLAGAWTKRDGYDTNEVTGNRIDGRNLWSTRATLRFEPTDTIHANLIWEHFQEDDDRLRSGKQLCHTDTVTNVAGFPTAETTPLPVAGSSAIWSGVQGTFSQGCRPASLYSPDSFQTPNGLSLPYVHPLSSIGVPIAGGISYFDPYQSRFQSTDLRVIESTVDPKYRAKSDVVEFQFSADLADHLTLTSETGYNIDTIFSTQDYNRFATAPGVFSQPSASTDYSGFNRQNWLLPGPVGGIFCDPQIGCSDRLVAVDLSTARSRQFSEELRLASDYEGPFNFSLGANFLRYDTEDKYYVFINTLSAFAALSPYQPGGQGGARNPLPPYMPGVTDNADCLKFGFVTPNPNATQNVNGCVYMDPNPIGQLNDLGHNYFLSRNPYKLISYAVFGEAYYNITPQLKLTAGLRWTDDKKVAPRIPSWILAADTVGYPVAEIVKQEWREPTGRLALDWKPQLSFTDETLIYGSYARGYKAGGMNPPASGIVCYFCAVSGGDPSLANALIEAIQPKTFKPEFVNAFEIGAKNTMLDGRLTLNTAAFYYDYTGYQISQIVNRAAVNDNFDATVYGLEIEADWRPLDNLRLGFKGGYEHTEVAKGMKAVDVMDRTAGDPNWVVVRPFPTFPSNCIIPTALFVGTPFGGSDLGLVDLGQRGTGAPGPCELAYLLGDDPVTGLPYVPNPTQGNLGTSSLAWHPGYQGWDPATAPNHGAGISKDLSGNSLPNAPHFTATITADYTVPLPNEWLMTLHTDLYYQSEAWARIFNMPGYDKLKAYNNVNFAAIFSNEDAGWKVMAYVKNVFDKANITGSFLNSDDSGLTTNVFLNEPRLYGLRITKDWTGEGWWTGAGANHVGPYPLTVEIGGEIQRQDAPTQAFAPASLAGLPPQLALKGLQNRNLDWGDGRSITITYRPEGSAWRVSAGVRYGRTNNSAADAHHELEGAKTCALPTTGPFAHIAYLLCNPASPYYRAYDVKGPTNWSHGTARDREEHLVADFDVGRDVGLGAPFSTSTLSAGLRYADFRSDSDLSATAIAGWYWPDAWAFKYVSHYGYNTNLHARRDFKGAGPTLSWDAATRLIGSQQAGHVDLDWSVTGGALFGKQTTRTTGRDTVSYYVGRARYWPFPQVGDTVVNPPPAQRSNSATVPVVDLSLGLSYEVQRMKVSTGYHWERYFNALDAGYAEHKSYDRTFDGPYFKIAVGFGG